MFLGVFLVPFHWWAWFSDHGPLLVKIITSIFEAVLLFAVAGLSFWVVELKKEVAELAAPQPNFFVANLDSATWQGPRF